jgi:glutamate synthase (ferredoxin)
MSGGMAWVLDEKGDFATRVNTELVGLGEVEDEGEAETLKELVRRHAAYTQSSMARRILADWEAWLPRFVRVLPHDYRRVLEAQERMRERGLPEDEAVMAAFAENAQNPVRVSGN